MQSNRNTGKEDAYRSAEWASHSFPDSPDTAAIVPAPSADRLNLNPVAHQAIRSSPDPPVIGRQSWPVALLCGPCW